MEKTEQEKLVEKNLRSKIEKIQALANELKVTFGAKLNANDFKIEAVLIFIDNEQYPKEETAPVETEVDAPVVTEEAK